MAGPDIEATVKAAADAVTNPESITTIQKDGRLRSFMLDMAAPAISVLLMAIVVVLTWGFKIGLWTDKSELERASYVGVVAVSLSIMLGIIVWTAVAGKPRRLEVHVGPSTLMVENQDQGSPQ